jgi:hypothetical protein
MKGPRLSWRRDRPTSRENRQIPKSKSQIPNKLLDSNFKNIPSPRGRG